MKKSILLIFGLLLTVCSYGQTKQRAVTKPHITQAKSIKQDSLLTDISQRLESIEFRIRGLDRYKMYPTENIYNFLKLDTATGIIELVQWSSDKDEEFSRYVNDEVLTYTTDCGTFELYPTQNRYQFILLNKVTGQTWHVQWSFEEEERWIRRIY